MATTADSASSNHSPRSSGDGVNSPPLRRKNLSSPRAHIIRGDSEAVAAAPSLSSAPPTVPQEQIHDPVCSPVKASLSPSSDNSASEAKSDNSDNSNNAHTKKPVWNKLSNGVVDVGPVMGAVSWPALSESTRASPKSSSDSLKALSDGSASISQGPVIVSSPQKQSTNSANPNSTSNHAIPVRQKSMKRGVGGGGPANGGFTQPPPPQPVEMPPGPVVSDSSPKTGPRGGIVSQPHVGNGHPQQRNSFRRSNSGPHSRGDGSYHNNYGGRRDQDRGNSDWNPHRSFNGRDVHMHPRVVPRTFVRHPPSSSTPFISPPPLRPFGSPMGFPDMTSPVYYFPAPAPAPVAPESFRPVPFITHAQPPAMIFPVTADPQLCTMLVKQIEYYFSPGNLCKDTFLRGNMDEQGWVSVSLISTFNRVKQLTSNIPLILDAVRTSTIVEVQGDRIRKRDDWMNWPPLPPSNQFATASGPQSPGISSYDMLATHFQGFGLEEGKTTNHHGMRSPADAHTEAVLSRSSSGESNNQSTASNGEGTGQVTIQAGYSTHVGEKF